MAMAMATAVAIKILETTMAEEMAVTIMEMLTAIRMEMTTLEITMVLVMELKIQGMGMEIRTVSQTDSMMKILRLMHKITSY